MGNLKLKLIEPVPASLDQDLLRQSVGHLNHNPGELALPEGIINLKLVNDTDIRSLNKEYAGADYATDVLAFSYLEGGGPIDGVLGEIMISQDMAKRQADQLGHSFSEEVAILALHGMLHILGKDHQTPAEQGKMDLLQAKYCKLAGIPYKFNWIK